MRVEETKNLSFFQEDQKIVIWKAKRQGKKYITHIQGVEKFGMNLFFLVIF